MKEIDFLPQWYKAGRRRHINYRTQYVGIFGILSVMILWSALTGQSVSSARAHINRMKKMQTASSAPLVEYNKIKNRLQALSGQAEILDAVKSRISISKVLAELAFLIDQRIVLSELEIKAESFDFGDKNGNTNNYMVTTIQETAGNKKLPLEGDVRFRILVTGLAMNASDVARLVRTFEDSPYVCDVRPMFSRNKNVKNYQSTEFQISCYLANYREEN